MTTPGGEKLTEEAANSNPISVMVDAMRERLRSPFFSAVAIAWVLINWRALLFVCFDGRAILDRIEYLDTHQLSLKNSVVYPVAAALIYVILSPWAVLLIGWYRAKSEIRINIRKMAELKRLANEQREIDDPGGVARHLKQINEDIARQTEFLRQTQKQDAETKERQRTTERQIEERRISDKAEHDRTLATKNQLLKDIEGMTSQKEKILNEIHTLQKQREALQAERDKIRSERVEYLSKPLTEANTTALKDFISALTRHGMAMGPATRFMLEQGAPRGALMEASREFSRARASRPTPPPILPPPPKTS